MKPDEILTDNNKTLNNYMLLPLHASSHSPLIPYYSYGSTVAVGSDVYIIGAPDMAKPSLAVRILDCRSHAWRDGPNMKLAREGASAVYLDGKIYVMGGYKKYNESMAWMEVLDIKTQTWSSLASHGDEELRSYGTYLSINVLHGKIYAMDVNMKDYAYDPKIGTWEIVETLSSGTSIYAWCVIEDVMYGYKSTPIIACGMTRRVESGERSRVRIWNYCLSAAQVALLIYVTVVGNF